ncbi:hypothetical protein [Sphingobacterium sp. CZ-2]|uniref:hypothetical protein n=1 Tax=Sphingobacterium sp. CZ-2 TaxID=2557994 RepID=UPI00107041F8|nr:hypothetical protein [Sphingobacterium sp. CZ-2]QBR12990.1 hypothetical protein E3D81_12780 [Sphingobacterium sp. CZ-2]
MKLALRVCFFFAFVFSFTAQVNAEPFLPNSSKISLSDSTISENSELFYRVGENHLLEVVYKAIFGEDIANTILWLNVFSENSLMNFSDSDFLLLESNKSGGFEIYDDYSNYISVAPDLDNNYSLETNSNNWVKSRSNRFNKWYFSTGKGREYTMTMKFSFAGKRTVKDEKGYEITVNGKLNGSYELSDNEGRKMEIKFDRSGVFRMIEGGKEIKTLVVQSQQSFRLNDAGGESVSIRARGRFNDLILTFPDGQEVFVKNRYRKPLPVVKEEEKK